MSSQRNFGDNLWAAQKDYWIYGKEYLKMCTLIHNSSKEYIIILNEQARKNKSKPIYTRQFLQISVFAYTYISI